MKKKMTRSEAGKLGAIKSIQIIKEKHKQSIQNYYLAPKICKTCKIAMSFKQKHNIFCSHSCAAKYNNKTKETRFCQNCNKPLCGSMKKFCNNTCNQRLIYLNWTKRWLVGKETGIRKQGMTISSHIKHWLIEQYGEKCSLCGWNEKNIYSNRIPIQVDHIDGNSLNNKPDNLRLLCPNCHSLTSTFGSLNKGNGRIVRRKNYNASMV